MSGMNIVDTNLLPLAARVAVRGCLLAMSSLQSSASSISLNRDTGETELLERAASPTLDGESVLRDLATGRYSAMSDSVSLKRGPWRRVG